MIDYSMERSIGDFAAAGSTKGTDTSISLMLEGSGKIAPIVGSTKGRSAMDSYTETGDIQAVRTVAKTTENYNYGTLGAKAKLGALDIALIRHSDNTNQAKISPINSSSHPDSPRRTNTPWCSFYPRAVGQKGGTRSRFVTGSRN